MTIETKVSALETKVFDIGDRVEKMENAYTSMMKDIHVVAQGVQSIDVTMKANKDLLELSLKNIHDNTNAEIKELKDTVKDGLKRLGDVAYSTKRKVDGWDAILKFSVASLGFFSFVGGILWFILGRLAEHGITFF